LLVFHHPESGITPIGKEGGGTVRPRKCRGSQFSVRSGWLSTTRCSTGVLTALIVNHGASPRSQASPSVREGTFGGAECGGYAFIAHKVHAHDMRGAECAPGWCARPHVRRGGTAGVLGAGNACGDSDVTPWEIPIAPDTCAHSSMRPSRSANLYSCCTPGA
jgi:hypothetical protein